MSELEPRGFQFPWCQDAEGYFLKFHSGESYMELREENTVMYIYPNDHQADHIFVMTHVDEDGMVNGFRLWREVVDNSLGDGAFQSLCDSLHDHEFRQALDEEPNELDIQAWEKTFNRPYRESILDGIVALETNKLAEAWEFYEQEWRGIIE